MKIVSVNELKIGMYVNLGKGLSSNTILEEQFLIQSEKQIANIMDQGIEQVAVDPNKSDIDVADFDDAGPDMPGEGDFNPLKNVGAELLEIIADENAPPEKKAKAVYDNSIKMMHQILERPSSSNILQGKEMISNIVDHILVDDETASALTQITSHDFYTYTHSVNVGMYGILLAKEVYKDTDENMRELGAGFFLHDLGKCEVPKDLINKPGKLTAIEWEQMRMHPTYGERILASTDHLSETIRPIVVQHHEREDGSGYPHGRKGHHIHDYARLCTIADVYDALTSERSYKKSLPPAEALRVMKDEMISHFNKDLFGHFVKLFIRH